MFLRHCTAILLLAGTAGAAVPLPVGALLEHPAHYFDLQHQRVRFAPRGPAQYDVTTAPSSGKLTPGSPAQPGAVRLPFPFPFAGKTWDEVYLNVTGTLTFGAPEFVSTFEHPERETWPNGTMRWLASVFDIDALTGKRLLIAPLWGLNSADRTHLFVRQSRTAFTVTWQAVRHFEIHNGYPPLGENTFQAILRRDGSIEFRYGDVAEKDGIVGVFCGRAPAGRVLDQVELPPAPHVAPEVDLRHAIVTDDGADLHFSATLTGPPPAHAASTLRYMLLAVSGHSGNGVLLDIGPSGGKTNPMGIVLNQKDNGFPDDASVRMAAIPHGRSVDFYVPKIGLKDPATLEWKIETYSDINGDAVARTGDVREVALTGNLPFGCDFRRGVRKQAGNIYEVFYYPFVPKGRLAALEDIYRRTPAKSEFTIVLTDFRIDDIHDAGASNGWDNGEPKEMVNAPELLQAAGPIYMGPQFAERVEDRDRTYRNYAFAVAYMAHEITHHWVATLKWKPPNPDVLVAGTTFHWSPMLFTHVVTPVWSLFTDKPYPEESIMGGMEVEALPDGSKHSVIAPWGAPSGLCALDLYQMGLIGPEEVPDTFFIGGAKRTGNGDYKGGEVVPVTIADLIAANGPPPPKNKGRYRVEIYLLHEDGREPDAARLAQVRGMEAALSQYFQVATNGRMIVEPAE